MIGNYADIHGFELPRLALAGVPHIIADALVLLKGIDDAAMGEVVDVDEDVLTARGWLDKAPSVLDLVELHRSLKHREQIPCLNCPP